MNHPNISKQREHVLVKDLIDVSSYLEIIFSALDETSQKVGKIKAIGSIMRKIELSCVNETISILIEKYNNLLSHFVFGFFILWLICRKSTDLNSKYQTSKVYFLIGIFRMLNDIFDLIFILKDITIKNLT